MNLAKHSSRFYCAAFAVALFAATSAFAQGPHEKTLYSFQGNNGAYPDGWGSQAGLTADANGNLYGTSYQGGTNTTCPCGTVFELSPPTTSGGTWTETILHSFAGGNSDGANPAARLIFDKAGNLYGTTSAGGTNNQGTVFELSPPATSGGSWTETVLYIFPADGSRGSGPENIVIADATRGTLIGTTGAGGRGNACLYAPGGCGVLYRLTPDSSRTVWTQTVLHNFGMTSSDIFAPANLTLHNNVLYGTAQKGADGETSLVFQMVHPGGTWSDEVLFEFPGGGSIQSPSALTFDAAGNIFGAARSGGGNCVGGCGGIFELTKSGATWTGTTLYTFTGGKDGQGPIGNLAYIAGSLYGTTRVGGLKNSFTQGNGTIFQLSPPSTSGDPWTETTMHEFGGTHYNDGSQPFSGLVFVKGKFYGTTNMGGSLGFGTVFSLTIAP